MWQWLCRGALLDLTGNEPKPTLPDPFRRISLRFEEKAVLHAGRRLIRIEQASAAHPEPDRPAIVDLAPHFGKAVAEPARAVLDLREAGSRPDFPGGLPLNIKAGCWFPRRTEPVRRIIAIEN